MRPDLRLVPFASLAWALAWWATGGGSPVAPVGMALGCLVWLVWRSLRPRRRPGQPLKGVWQLIAGVLLTLVLVAAFEARNHQRHAGLLGEVAATGGYAQAELIMTMDAQVRSDSPTRPPFAVARAQLTQLDARGDRVRASTPVLLMATGEGATRLAAIPPGTRVRLGAIVRPPAPGDAVSFVLRLRGSIEVLAEPGAIDAAVNTLRSGLQRATAHSPPSQAALLPSLVVGDTSRLSDEVSEEFRATALTHLLAVSGANLTLLLGFIHVAARWAGARGRLLRVLGLIGVAFFVLLCRSEPSVLRAAAMGLAAMAALGVGGRHGGVRSISLAVLALVVIDPWLARSWGFALSVAATAGIVWWSAAWRDRMATWLPAWLAEACSVPLAAQVATQPLVTALNGEISLVGLVANVLAAPFVGPATVLGLIAALLSPMSLWLATVSAWLGGWCVQPILWIAHAGATVPRPTLTLGSSAPVIVGLIVACWGASRMLPWLLARRAAALVCVLALLGSTLVRLPAHGWPTGWAAVFCDVGQGDATLLRASAQQAVVVDVGPPGGAVLDCLQTAGTRAIPLLVVTHYHADHIGSLDQVLQRFPVDAVLVSALPSPAATAADVRRLAEQHGARVIVAEPGMQLVAGEVTWLVTSGRPLARPAADEGESSVENDASVIGVAQVGALRVLLAGDAEPAGQSAALRAASHTGIDLRVHVLKLPHHGSSRQDPGFFDASDASLAVASAGQDNDYGHPSPKALALASQFGMSVRRTDTDGSIAVWVEGDRVLVATR